MKFLYAASVVLLGAGLGVAQCNNQAAVAPSNSTTQTMRASDDSPISRMNPVTGDNPETHQNPNAIAPSSAQSYRASLSKKKAHTQQVSNTTTTSTASGN